MRRLLLLVLLLAVVLAIYMLLSEDKQSRDVVAPSAKLEYSINPAKRSTAAPHPAAEPIAPPLIPAELASGPGGISGKVYGADGLPADGAAVAICRAADMGNRDSAAIDLATPASATAPEWSATAEAAGAFAFQDLPIAHYGIVARAEGLIGFEHTQLSLTRRQAEVTVTLEPAAAVAGTVVNAAGEPLPGVALYPWLRDEHPFESYATALLGVTTSENGAFAFEGLPEGAYAFLALSEAYAPQFSKAIAAGATDAVIVLASGGAIAGTARYEENDAVAPGLTFEAYSTADKTVMSATLSNEEGAYMLAPLPPGGYAMRLRHPSFVVVGNAETTVAGDETAVLDLRVGQGGAIQGRIYEEGTDKGVGGVRVRIRGKASAPSDSQGYYELAGLPGGEYNLSLEPVPGYEQTVTMRLQQKVSVPAGGTVEHIDFALPAGLSVEGTVTDASGTPVAGAAVQAVILGMRKELVRGESGDGGRFRLMGFEPSQEITLRAQSGALASPLMTGLLVGPDGLSGLSLILDEPWNCMVSGTVVDSYNNPLYAHVSLEAVETSENELRLTQTRTTDSGTFVIENFPAGDYVLRTSVGNYDWRDAMKLTFAPGQAITGLRVVHASENLLTIEGRTIDEAGKPVPGVSVQAAPQTEGVARMASARSGADGAYILEGLSPGEYAIMAFHDAHEGVPVEHVPAGAKAIDILMIGGGALTGQVIDAVTKQPVTHFQVRARFSGVEAWRIHPQSFNDPGGRFSIDAEPGRYDVEVRAEGYQTALVTLDAPSDAAVIPLQPGEAVLRGTVVNGQGQAVSGARIFESASALEVGGSPLALTDSAGAFEIKSFSPALVVVFASHPAEGIGSGSVALDRAGQGSVAIQLMPPGAIEGRIDGVSSAGSVVIIECISSDGLTRSAHVKRDGRFSMANLPPGTMILRMRTTSNDGQPYTDEQDVVVNPGETATVEFTVP